MTELDNNKGVSYPRNLKLILQLYSKNFHLLIAYSVLAFGGIILLLHFIYAEYFPKSDLPSLLILLVSIALVGGTIVTFLVMTLMVPSVIWSIFSESSYAKLIISSLEEQEKIASEKKKVRSKSKNDKSANSELKNNDNVDSKPPSNENITSESKNSDKLKQNNHLLWFSGIFVIPICFSMLIFVIEYFVYINASISFIDQCPKLTNLILFSLTALWGFVTYKWVLKLKIPDIGWLGFLAYLVTLLSSFSLYMLTPFLVLILFVSKYSSASVGTSDDWQLLFCIFSVSVVSLFFNAIYLAKSLEKKSEESKQTILQQFGFGLLLTFLVIVISNSWFSIPQAVLKIYGLADVENIRVVAAKDDCLLISELKIQGLLKKGDTCTINNALLVSAIGSDYFFQSIDGKRFSLPQNAVKISRLPIAPIELELAKVTDNSNSIQQINYSLINKQKINSSLTIKDQVTTKNISLTFSFFDAAGDFLGTKGPIIIENVPASQPTEKTPLILDGKYEEDKTKIIDKKVAWFSIEMKIEGREYWFRTSPLI